MTAEKSTLKPEGEQISYDSGQWWVKELEQFWGDSDHAVTLDTRRAVKIALDAFAARTSEGEQISGARSIEGSPLLEWAISRWNAEVKHRPLNNVHRRSLDDAWRQVIRWAGGDPVALVGPSHDELLADMGGKKS